jgi:hypothetical protein
MESYTMILFSIGRYILFIASQDRECVWTLERLWDATCPLERSFYKAVFSNN